MQHVQQLHSCIHHRHLRPLFSSAKQNIRSVMSVLHHCHSVFNHDFLHSGILPVCQITLTSCSYSVVATKTEVSICVLPFLLVPPPLRGVRGPRTNRASVLQMLFVNFKVRYSYVYLLFSEGYCTLWLCCVLCCTYTASRVVYANNSLCS